MNTYQDTSLGLVGNVFVRTVDNRGLTPEEIAETALDKIIYVGEQSHPIIRDQALAFRENVRKVLVFYIQEGIKNDRATIANKLRNAGHPELINLLED